MIYLDNSATSQRPEAVLANADTPVLATNGLIEDPVNPFTGRKITDEEKYAHPQVVTTSLRWRTSKEDKTFNTSDGKWLSVHDDIFDEDNWELLE